MDYYGCYTINFKLKSGSSSRLDVTNLRDNHEVSIHGQELVSAVRWTGHVPPKVRSVRLNEQAATKTELAEKIVDSNGHPFLVVFTKANGKLREMHCHLVSSERLLGHALVFDYEVNDFRQVDLRTVQELIIGDTHYKLKGK